MNLAASYAKALFELVEAAPHKGSEYLTNLKASLKSRGHQKLLPRIFSEYQKLEIQKERSAAYKKVTPELVHTAALVELYRKLIA